MFVLDRMIRSQLKNRLKGIFFKLYVNNQEVAVCLACKLTGDEAAGRISLLYSKEMELIKCGTVVLPLISWFLISATVRSLNILIL